MVTWLARVEEVESLCPLLLLDRVDCSTEWMLVGSGIRVEKDIFDRSVSRTC